MHLKSAEIIKLGEHNYLQVFLQKEYPYQIKHNGNEFDVYEFIFREPEAGDMLILKKLGISLEKLHSYQYAKSIKIANLFSKDSLAVYHENKEEQSEDAIDEEKKEVDYVANCKDFISRIFGLAADFEDESTDYYQELEKFFNFVESKCYREQDGLAIRNSLSNIDKYKATSYFIKEEIIIEYISFFFAHFPSKSLHINIQ